jgi:hypothetical protein
VKQYFSNWANVANKRLLRTAGQRHDFHDVVDLNVRFLSTVFSPRSRRAAALEKKLKVGAGLI